MKYYYKDVQVELAPEVYEPAEDSELLAGELESHMRPGISVLDMGCGAGLLGVLAAKAGAVVTAADINPTAVELAQRNAVGNGVKIKAICSDLFEKVAGTFDMIVFNPPYLPDNDDVPGSETWAMRDVLERFVRHAAAHLRPGGLVLVVVSSLTPAERIVGMLVEAGFAVEHAAQRKVPWETLSVLRARLQGDTL